MMTEASIWSEIQSEFPKAKTALKTSWFWRALAKVFPRICTDFVTTIGWTIYLPTTWPRWGEWEKAAVLRHERVHLRQQRKYTRFLFGLSYALFPLPVFLAWFRWRWEREAYVESLRCYRESGFGHDVTDQVTDHIVSTVCGSGYAWAWPKKWAKKWFVEHSG